MLLTLRSNLTLCVNTDIAKRLFTDDQSEYTKKIKSIWNNYFACEAKLSFMPNRTHFGLLILCSQKGV